MSKGILNTIFNYQQSFITLRVAHTGPVASACSGLWQSKYLVAVGRFCLSMADAFFLVSGVGIVVVDESIGPVAHAQELISSQWSSASRTSGCFEKSVVECPFSSSLSYENMLTIGVDTELKYF